MNNVSLGLLSGYINSFFTWCIPTATSLALANGALIDVNTLILGVQLEPIEAFTTVT